MFTGTCTKLGVLVKIDIGYTTENTEWQRPLSGVHSIMMEKLVQAGEGISTITYKVVVYAPAERADTLPLFSTLPRYLLCRIH
jgi:hypothetical protein